VVAARFAGFAGAAVLAGAPLAFARSPGDPPRAVPLVAAGALLTLAGALAALVGETQVMAGDPAAGSDPAMLWTVLAHTGFGRALAVRFALAAAAGLCLLAPARGLRWVGAAGFGFAALLSFAWTGHGAADEGLAGQAHLAADLAHLAAAGVWLGALAALLAMAAGARRTPQARAAFVAALQGFSGLGSLAVAILLASGVANGWFLVGPQHLAALTSQPYGRLLLAKVALFAAMTGFAALNRFRLTPALAAGGPRDARPIVALALSIGLESLAGLGLLAVVAVLGAMAPLSAQ